jgi:hypothetical protein
MHLFKKYRVLTILVVVSLWCGFGLGERAAAAASDFPFQPGERLVYRLFWGVIPAGYAELEVLPFKELDGESSWHFLLSVRTSEFVDLFYKVRDRIESLTDLALANSIFYRKEQREGRTDRDVVVRFDREARSVVYSDKGEARNSIEIKEGTIDPLASLYFIRSQPLAENLEIVRPVTDGKKIVKGVAKVVGREMVRIDGGEYDTFIVEPDLQDLSGLFEKSKDSKLQLWITADDSRTLIKVKSKVMVGSFTATLVEGRFPR